MAHPEQVLFCKSVKEKLPECFKNRLVVDIGSLDINGSNHYLFENCLYFGLDLAPGKNVDFVSNGHELNLPDESVDTIISTECFEHDQFYDLTIKNIVRMLKPGGLFIFSCATTGRPEHGTRRTSPQDAPLTQMFGEWGDYYKNLEESHIREILDIDTTFSKYAFSINNETHDLYFWGIKSGEFVEGINSAVPMIAVTMLKDTVRQYAESHGAYLAAKIEAEAAKIEAEAAKIEAERMVKEITSSRSWRITKPLRMVRSICSRSFIKKVFSAFVRLLFRYLKCAMPSETVINHGTGTISHVTQDIASIVTTRCHMTEQPLLSDHLTVGPASQELPEIDMSVVTHNNGRWVKGFVDSLLNADCVPSKVNIYFVDNSSTDDTVSIIEREAVKLRDAGFNVLLRQEPNKGFGAGHNIGIGLGKAKFCLVTNIDLTFDRAALKNIISIACNDIDEVVTWELRQKPYEHPKFYDPVTGLTTWSAHACVLIRRSAFERVGGYDETIFMYGEDVELSYHLRSLGFLLRYCPSAVVYHYSYAEVNEIKPVQYIGSVFANLYLRLKYGTVLHILAIPAMLLMRFVRKQPFAGARYALLRRAWKLLTVVPRTLLGRKRHNTYFAFYGWDYSFRREGAFIACPPLPDNTPLVSIITRTYEGRELFLRQSLLSVAHQTYPNIEHIVVQDGGSSMNAIVDEVINVTNSNIKFFGATKSGRSAIGNIGLAKSSGKWCMIFDDDDLLFSDHIEILVNALINDPKVSGVSSFAAEILTDVKVTNGIVQSYTEKEFKLSDAFNQPISAEELRLYNYLPVQSVLFERELFEERGGFDEDMELLEDWILWNRYAKGKTFGYVAKCTSMFRSPYHVQQIKVRHKMFSEIRDVAKARVKMIHEPASSLPKMLFPAGHFYSPIVDATDIQNRANNVWQPHDTMQGIDMKVEQQLALLNDLKPYLSTVNYPISKPIGNDRTYFYNNDQYPALDAEFLYAAIQYFKPASIIEVGSGFSSLVIADVNMRFFKNKITFTCIEPYPRQFLRDGVNGVTTLLVNKVEDIEATFFDCLNENDILFIDSSHVSKTGSDVNYLFFDILPRLKPGVVVHIHDIFLPDEYPKQWVINEGRNWNEQYLLRAFLQYNSDWEVLWAAHFMGTRYVKEVQKIFIDYQKCGPGGSFWIRKKA